MGKSQHGMVVNPDRLCAAADMLLRAVQSRRGWNSRVEARTGPPQEAGQESKEAFTCDELTEAMSMLIRMGVVSSDLAGPRIQSRL